MSEPPKRVWSASIEVLNRLEELGMPSADKLIAVAEAMIAAKAECTDNDPPGAGGWSAWCMGTRRLREEMLSIDGWERDDGQQISSVINLPRGIRIAVANTDDGTCLEDRVPQNRSKKGAATDRAVQMNQGSFLHLLDATVIPFPNAAANATASDKPLVTWYFCVYGNGDDIRAELSCPVGVESGFFTGFSERIFIIGGNDDGGLVRKRSDDSGDPPDLEIPVKRK